MASNNITVLCRTGTYSRLFSISGYWFTNDSQTFEYYVDNGTEVAGTIYVVENVSLIVYINGNPIIEIGD